MLEFIAVFLVSYVLHACGITIGYHRLLSHRAFTCSKPVEYFWVFLGLLAFEGSPIWWATIHRAHHRYTDMEKDPHSPRNGLMYSLTGWLAEKEYLPHLDPHKQCKDLLKDPVYRFLECGGNLQASHGLSFAIGFGVRGILWALFGWQVALASLLAGFAVLAIPLMLNVICHLPSWGYKTYAGDDDSVNVWWVGLLAMGEGWHNNHHAAPGSAKTGMMPWEFDLSWLIIQAMHKFKLIDRMNVATHYQLYRASMKRQVAQARAGKAPTHRLIDVTSRKRKRARVRAS